MSDLWVALAALASYVVISLLVGDRFPFSRYSMYARLTHRREGAVLYVKAGEVFVAPDDLELVSGLDVPALDPKRVPCSQEWPVYEAQRWLTLHSVDEPPKDAVRVEVGYRILSVGADGVLSMRLDPVTVGRGRLRK